MKYGLLPDIYTYSSVSSYYTPANLDEFTQKNGGFEDYHISRKTRGGRGLVIYELPHEIFLVGFSRFFTVILMSLIEVQNVFLMINFDVWDRLGHV